MTHHGNPKPLIGRGEVTRLGWVTLLDTERALCTDCKGQAAFESRHSPRGAWEWVLVTVCGDHGKANELQAMFSILLLKIHY